MKTTKKLNSFLRCSPLFFLLLLNSMVVNSQSIYWVSNNEQIVYHGDYDGFSLNKQAIIMTTYNPTGLDVHNGKVYWTESDSADARISRADLDGTNIEILPILNLDQPEGIKAYGNQIYWLDSGNMNLRRANLNGTNAVNIAVGLNAGADIAIEGGKIFITNPVAEKIQRLNLDGTGLVDIHSGLNSPLGLAARSGKLYWAEADSLFRSNLDGTNKEGIYNAGFGRPVDIAVSVGSIFWTNELNGMMQRADLDGNFEQGIDFGLSDFPRFIDVDNSILETEYLYACKGDNLSLCHSPDTIAPSSVFQWYDGTGTSVSGFLTDTCFTINNLDTMDTGIYFCRVLDDSINVFPLAESPPFVVQLYAEDSLGGKYPPDQVVVEWMDTTTEAWKNVIQDLYLADSLGACVCGGIELWRLFPEDLIIAGQTLSDIEDKINKMRTESGPEEVEFNYMYENNTIPDTSIIVNPNEKGILVETNILPPIGGQADDTIRVAVIDTGVKANHSQFVNQAGQTDFGFFKNPSELGADQDSNCIIGDFVGYNFADDISDPTDDQGHGTHVADLVRQIFYLPLNPRHDPPTNVRLELMNIKSHDSNGNGLLFDEVCSFVYATENKACIINFSAGRYGLSSEIMKNTLDKARDEAGALIITSAGNDNKDNTLEPHYPSSYPKPHIIEVAAGIYENNDFESFSQVFGLTKWSNSGPEVDIVARGNLTLAADFDDINGQVQKEGTSMAAAIISGVAARAKALCPNLKWDEIKEYILTKGASATNWDSYGEVNNDRVLIYDTDYFVDLVEVQHCLLNATQESGYKPWKVETFPNPYSEELNVLLESPGAHKVEMEVHNLLGHLVFRQNILLQAGKNAFVWDGLGIDGAPLVSGIYVLSLRSSSGTWSGKIIKQ